MGIGEVQSGAVQPSEPAAPQVNGASERLNIVEWKRNNMRNASKV